MTDLFLVLGGRVMDARGREFRDPASLDIVGLFGGRAADEAAWRSASQRSIDDAEIKYLVIDMAGPLADPAKGHKAN
ncbi:DUF4170 domain-containing protein [Sphingomonas abietis]|uniref:DUF4170 domain-containing protein n=2 Tax=Sphingomonas abietis TaxID=3012344 RepID=A0ABY7NTR5_9SPHN|nr:DUF4170 domain-containing protein [Sphingomonas abietis]